MQNPGIKDHGIIARFLKNRAIMPWSCKPVFTLYGKVDQNGERTEPTFPIKIWNLHDRILLDKPTTNNPVESWHRVVTADTKTHGTLNVVLKEVQLEQSKTESHIKKLDSGEVLKKKKLKPWFSNIQPI